MINVYKKLGFVTEVLTEAFQWTDTPGGEMDLDRALANQACFVEEKEGQAFKKKTLFLTAIPLPEGLPENDIKIWKWQVFTLLRQLLDEGFMLMHYQKESIAPSYVNRFFKLNSASMAYIDFQKEQMSAEAYKEILKIFPFTLPANGMATLDSHTIQALLSAKTAHIKSDTIWASDLAVLDITPQEITEKTGCHFKRCIKDTLASRLDSASLPQDEPCEIISVWEILQKIQEKKELTAKEKALLSESMVSHYIQSNDLFDKLFQTLSTLYGDDEPYDLHFINWYDLAIYQPERYIKLIMLFKEKAPDLFKMVCGYGNGGREISGLSMYHAEAYAGLLNALKPFSTTDESVFLLKAKHSDGTDALYYLAWLAPKKYAELLEKLRFMKSEALFEYALKAKHSSGKDALFVLASKLPEKYAELLETLRVMKPTTLFECALKAKYPSGTSALYSLALKLPEKYADLLKKLSCMEPKELFEYALKARHSDGTNALFYFALKLPEKFIKLVENLNEPEKKLLYEWVLKKYHPMYGSILYNLKLTSPQTYDQLLEHIKPNDTSLHEEVARLSQVGSFPVTHSLETVDVNTTDSVSRLSADRVFYSIGPTVHPPPSNYRFSCYNTLEVETEQCAVDAVFKLKNTGDAEWRDVDMSPSPNNTYNLAQTLSKEGQRVYYATRYLNLSTEKQALPSLDIAEKMLAFHTDPKVEMKLQYSQRDGLYYVWVENPALANTIVSIDYLIGVPRTLNEQPSVPRQAPEALQQLKTLIASFGNGTLNVPKNAHLTGEDFLHLLIRQKVGACRHRAAVFKAIADNPERLIHSSVLENISEVEREAYRALAANLKLLKEQGSLQVAFISNGIHAFNEVTYQGMRTRYDLGGSPADLTIHDTFAPPTQKAQARNAPPPAAICFPNTNAAESSAPSSPLAYAHRTLNMEAPKYLIEAEEAQIQGLLHELQRQATAVGKLYCYIDSANDLILNRPHVILKDNLKGEIRTGYAGAVYEFLEKARHASDRRPHTLIINFAHFSDSERVRFNSLLDKNPQIDGYPLPDHIKIIGVMAKQKTKDASFYSRFGSAVEQCPERLVFSKPAVLVSKPPDHTSLLEIDLHGAATWKATLLGTWKVMCDDFTFCPGLLIKQGYLRDPQATHEGNSPVRPVLFKNPPLDPEFQQFFEGVNLKGGMHYLGKQWEWTRPDLFIKHEIVLQTSQIHAVQKGFPEKAAHVLNSSLLSSFFKRYQIKPETNQLYEIDSLLATHANETPNTPLAVYVSENLSDGMWSQLLAACQRLNVKLSITLAPAVTLSPLLAEAFKITAMPATSKAGKSEDYCIESSDRDFSIKTYKQAHAEQDIICIDVSEQLSSDLLIKTTRHFNEKTLSFHFQQIEGALIDKLNTGHTVILHGTFSTEMRHHLQAYLHRRHHDASRKGRVIIISDNDTAKTFDGIVPIEKQTISPREKETLIPHRKWNGHLPLVSLEALARYDASGIVENAPWAGLKTSLPPIPAAKAFELSAPDKAKDDAGHVVNTQRTAAVKKVLDKQPGIVFLAGMTGVGKTAFVKEIWTRSQESSLHLGIGQLAAWANDRTPGIKTLFIDEANLSGNNWSQFEGLYHNAPPGMMVGNRYIELTENHKVIFAGNPTAYSKDRTLPSLFERHGNSVVFETLPPDYIYQFMLQPLFKDQTNEMIEEIVRPIFAIYQYLNTLSTTEVLLTPREMKMMVQLTLNQINPKKAPINLTDVKEIAAYVAYTLSSESVPEAHKAAFNTLFKVERPYVMTSVRTVSKKSRLVLTDANRACAEIVSDFLDCRQAQINSTEKQAPLGLGGVILEGAPGLGKSQLAIECLLARGLQKATFDAENSDPNSLKHELENKQLSPQQTHFYHLPASASLTVKRAILIRAFHEGAVVLSDEMNSAASQEQLLNQLLMGKDLDDKPATNPGFMLIGTQNPGSEAGRSKTSIAIKHRLHYRVMRSYTVPEMKAVLEGLGLPYALLDFAVSQHVEESQKNPEICFRHLMDKADNALKALFGKSYDKVTETDLKTLAEDSNSNAHRLEAVFKHPLCNEEIKEIIAKHANANADTLIAWVKQSTKFIRALSTQSAEQLKETERLIDALINNRDFKPYAKEIFEAENLTLLFEELKKLKEQNDQNRHGFFYGFSRMSDFNGCKSYGELIDVLKKRLEKKIIADPESKNEGGSCKI